jgi:hypothetical protein
MIPLTKYSLIKNNYCIGYYGDSNECISQLVWLRPLMEEKYPKIKIYLSFKDSARYLVEKQDRIILKSKFKSKKKDLAYFYEISKNEKYPILNLMEINEMIETNL